MDLDSAHDRTVIELHFAVAKQLYDKERLCDSEEQLYDDDDDK